MWRARVLSVLLVASLIGCKENNSAPVIDEPKMIEESKKDQIDARKGKVLQGN